MSSMIIQTSTFIKRNNWKITVRFHSGWKNILIAQEMNNSIFMKNYNRLNDFWKNMFKDTIFRIERAYFFYFHISAGCRRDQRVISG